jgi:glucose-1-phosphate thymidylyltransferase
MTTRNSNETSSPDVVGLLPAAGLATRVAPLPLSKELYPIGFQPASREHSPKPKVVSQYLLEKMRLAGVTKAFIVLRRGKWDIPAYFGDGAMLDMHLAYLMMRLPYGVPYTVNQAYPFVQDALVAFGFPDIIFQSDDAFAQLLARQATTNADIVLGLFPVHQPQKWDMVDLDENGGIRSIVIKPPQTHLRYAWIIAVWTPKFTQFMHEYLAAAQITGEENRDDDDLTVHRELFIGDVIQAAIHDDFQVESVLFPDDICLDIGTPDDLVKAVRGNFGF